MKYLLGTVSNQKRIDFFAEPGFFNFQKGFDPD